jgi:putative flippase GtrA
MVQLVEALHHRFKRPLRFVVGGVINTVVGLGIIYGCKYFLEMNNVLANIAGYVVGLTVSFALNSTWTFEYRGPKLSAMAVRALLGPQPPTESSRPVMFAGCWR